MKLKRSIGFFSLTNIVVANMIGAGIFTTTGIIMNDLSNPFLLIILWLLGGILALLGALSYGELGATYPKAGGEYIYLNELFHPILGFLSGWLSFIVGFSAPIAASAIGVSEYISRISDFGLAPGELLMAKKALAILVIVIFTAIHINGIKKGTIVQDVLTVLKIVIIVVLILVGFIWGSGNLEHFSPSNSVPLNSSNIKTYGLVLLWISFAYSGWNASTYVGSEVKNAKRNIPLSLLVGTSVVILLYAGLNILFVYAIEPENMKGVIAIGGLAVNNLFGLTSDRAFSLFIAFALLSSLSAFIMIGPRIYYSMAKNNHFFKVAASVNKNAVPAKSILFQSFLAIIYVLSGTFDQILTFMGISLAIFPMLTVFSVFKLRSKGKSKFKNSGYPYTQIIFLLFSISIFITAYLNRPIESSIAVGVTLLGIPFYYLLLNKNHKRNNSMN